MWDIVTRAWSQDAFLRPDINEIYEVVTKLHAEQPPLLPTLPPARSEGLSARTAASVPVRRRATFAHTPIPPAMKVVHCQLTADDLESHLNRIILLALPLLRTEWKNESQTLISDCKIWRSCKPEDFALSFERFGDHLTRSVGSHLSFC